MPQVASEAILERLRNGARIMGELWRAGARCTAAWSATGSCQCKKRSKFCVAREQWINLMVAEDLGNPARAIEDGGDPKDHPFALFENMLAAELEASCFTITLDNGVKIGPAGSVAVKFSVEISNGEAHGGGALAMLLRTFRGSKITKVETVA